MELQAADPSAYLGEDDVVDHSHPSVRGLAGDLRRSAASEVEFARLAFELVRDQVGHSWDVHDSRVTVSASEVLSERVGLCYSKAHLLAALLRAEGIPTGLCYQRLTDDEETFMLHGLVAVYLRGAWHRQDPRGNKPGVDAQFSLGTERLAWPVREELGETDYATVLPAPSDVVVRALRGATDAVDLCRRGLPQRL